MSQMSTGLKNSPFKKEIAEIWRLFKDTDLRMKETDRQMKENSLEMKKIQQSLKEAKELFTGQWGALIESLVEGRLVKLLQKRGLDVKRTGQRMQGTLSYKDEGGRECERICEVDLVAMNGEDIVAVEVKTTLNARDVKKFLSVLGKFKGYFSEYADKRVYGAMAFLRKQGEALSYGEKEGLFMIRATGDSAYIVNKNNFKPRLFG